MSTPTEKAPTPVNCICTIVADTDGVAPEVIEGSDLNSFKAELYSRLVRCKSGWCYPIIDGKRATLSSPRQVFELKLADGSTVKVEDPAPLVFEANGRFTTLQPPPFTL